MLYTVLVLNCYFIFRMLNLLERIASHPGNDSIEFLTELVQKLRPAKPDLSDEAAASVRNLTKLLQGRHSHRLY